MANNFFNLFRNEDNSQNSGKLVNLNISDIIANRYQPRKVFQTEKIKELAQNIDKNGLLQPIVVREYEPHKYEIVAGERRFRAVKSLNRTTIPAIVREFDDSATAVQALSENLQREDLSAIEEAQAYQEILNLTKGTQETLARQVGKSQSTVANKLRLLKLSDPVKNAINAGQITERHGREMLHLTVEQQDFVLKEIIAQNLSVVQTKTLVDEVLDPELKESPQAASTKTKHPAKPKANILNKVDNLTLATQTLKKSLMAIEQCGIKVTQEIKQIDADDVEMVVHLIKTKKAEKATIEPENDGN